MRMIGTHPPTIEHSCESHVIKEPELEPYMEGRVRTFWSNVHEPVVIIDDSRISVTPRFLDEHFNIKKPVR